MPPRKQKLSAKASDAAAAQAKAAADDADLNAMLDAAIRQNEAVPGSLAAQRLEQEQPGSAACRAAAARGKGEGGG